MWIEKRGRQFRTYWRADDKRHFEAFATREDAERFQAAADIVGLDRARLLLRSPIDEAAAPSPLGVTQQARPVTTLRMLFNMCWDQKHNVERRSREDALAQFEHYVQPFFGDVDVRLIKSAEKPHLVSPVNADGHALTISAWITWLQTQEGFLASGERSGRVLASKTIRNLHAMLSNVLEFAVDDDEDAILLRNPCEKTKFAKAQRGEMPWMLPGQFHDLLTAIDPWYRPFLLFLAGTGVRWGEAAGLRVKNVDLVSEQPSVYIQFAWRRGSRGMELGRVKTSASQRRVSLSPILAAALADLIDGKDRDDYVFAGPGGGMMHHSNFTSRKLIPAIDQAIKNGSSIDPAIRCHSFRHSHAAWLLSAGRPLRSVSQRLGHESQITTEKHYGHHMKEADTGNLPVIDEAIAGVVDGEFIADANGEDLPGLFVVDDADRQLTEIELTDDDDIAA